MKLAEIEVLATACEVHVSDGGTFSVYLLGHADEEGARALASSSTMVDAVEKAKPEVRKRKVKVDVPFYRMRGSRFDDWSFEQGTAHGFHAGTGNVMATEDGSSVQIATSGYRSDKLYRGDTPQEARDELVRLREESIAREKRVRELDEQWTVDIAEAVQTAITEAMA